MREEAQVPLTVGRVAITALLVALGATDDELVPVFRRLVSEEIPPGLVDIKHQAQDALLEHRRAGAG